MTTMVHNFHERLEASHRYADAPWWNTVYRKAFGTIVANADVRGDGWHQRAGIDRVLTLANSRTIRIDEKVREKDYNDILLERWSDRARQTPGWVQKDLACDYIAYAFAPSCRCYLLPFLELRRAWRLNGRQWIERYPTIEAHNDGWVTECIAVPIPDLLDAFKSALIINWRSSR